MNADLLGSIKARLPAATDRAALEKLAQDSGVPFHTLLKIAKGETMDPRVSTVQRLMRHFERLAA